jgi:hypothetical protein
MNKSPPNVSTMTAFTGTKSINLNSTFVGAQGPAGVLHGTYLIAPI